jgi:hypothetical protein
MEFWQAAVGVAGMGAIASFVLWSLYKRWLDLPIFQKLTKHQQFVLFRTFMVLTFLFALASLGAFVTVRSPAAASMPSSAQATGECTANDLNLNMERAGDLIPGQRGGDGQRYASGRLYQFLLSNSSDRCTARIENIKLKVLAATKDEHPMMEATTAQNDYEVVVAPSDVGKELSLEPLDGAPHAEWSFHYGPHSSPEVFRVHVVPKKWGYSYVLRFAVHWYNPRDKRNFTTESEIYAAFFPESDSDNPLAGTFSDAPEFRTKQRDTWSAQFGTKVN